MPGAALRVHHALGTRARVGANRQHQPPAAQGDKLVLQGRLRRGLTQQPPQRPVELLFRLADRRANFRQRGRGVVVNLAPGQDAPPDVFGLRGEVSKRGGQLAQARQQRPEARRAQLRPSSSGSLQ